MTTTLLSCRCAVLMFTLAASVSALGQAASPIEFDHAWIVVSPGASERSALEKAGFTISPNVNHHDGQGTSSISVEFENSYLELIWVDPKVSIAPGAERGTEKFRQRALWRTSGWSPIGLGFRRMAPTEPSFPFTTWSVSPGWLPKGSAIEILTPRDDVNSPSFFLTPRSLAVDEKMNGKVPERPNATLPHRLGTRRVTALRLVTPPSYKGIAALDYLQKNNLVSVNQGKEWVLELEFDREARGQVKDFRPDLPLLVRY